MLHPFRKSSFLFARHFAVSFTFSISLALLSLVSSTNAQDPGVRDTVRIEADSLVVGQSRPVRMIVSNDDQILNVTIPLC
ncbi:MAG TPA: hypothetical protein VHP63_03800, partial [candidate division Zixibacteria bacterium]|nr:hypothetical protein [candidate division Zixibacteria bacterium]